MVVQDGAGGQQGARGSAGGSISSGAPLGLDTLEGCRKRLGELATEMISLRQVVATQQSTISQLQVGPIERLAKGIKSFKSSWPLQPLKHCETCQYNQSTSKMHAQVLENPMVPSSNLSQAFEA